MISNISFGSTYKVTTDKNGIEKFSDFQKFIQNREARDGIRTKFEDNFSIFSAQPYKATCIAVAPDSKDYDIETFCANRGIAFEKYNIDYIMAPQNVVRRIEKAPKGMHKVNIDVKKLYELAKNQSTNIAHCETDYYTYYMDDVDFMLKSGKEIPATSLWIYPNGTNLDSTLEYIKRFKSIKLNDKQIIVDFSQRTDEPDHCVFFALKNLGMKEVPMYVDDGTYELASALGILK